jgi:hypothetical protein
MKEVIMMPLNGVYEHTYGDNYKLQVKDKMQEFIKE